MLYFHDIHFIIFISFVHLFFYYYHAPTHTYASYFDNLMKEWIHKNYDILLQDKFLKSAITIFRYPVCNQNRNNNINCNGNNVFRDWILELLFKITIIYLFSLSFLSAWKLIKGVFINSLKAYSVYSWNTLISV